MFHFEIFVLVDSKYNNAYGIFGSIHMRHRVDELYARLLSRNGEIIYDKSETNKTRTSMILDLEGI